MKNTQKKRLLNARGMLAFILICMSTFVFAQNLSITGTVLDEKGEAVIGASVSVKGTTTGTITDLDGKFALNVKPNDVLNIKFMGYEEQNVKVDGKNNFRIVLKEDSKLLNEVVVVGYGAVNRSNVVGSIVQINEKAIEDRPITRVEQALQGQMAGVSVRSTSGSPGSDITINVRGAASINGESTPLYVVDGVPLGNPSGINPGDIQSIDVLKDAASAAIYGSRGSNGVVLITTKRGKVGKPVITLTAYTAFSNVEKKVDVMDSQQWIDFNKKYYDRLWVNATGQSAGVSQAERIAYAERTDGKVYNTRTLLSGIRSKYGIYDPYWDTDELDAIDWQDALFRTAPSHNIELSASGATEDIMYSLSGAIFDQEGVVAGSSFERYNMRALIEAKMTDRIKVGFNLAPSFAKKYGADVDGKDKAVSRALSYPGWVLAGAGRDAGAEPYKFYDLWGAGANQVSPYIQATANTRINKDVRLNSSAYLNITPMEGLNVKGTVAWNFRANSERNYSPTWAQGAWDTSTPGEKSSSKKTTLMSHSLLMEGLITYDKTFGVHSLNALLGASQERYQEDRTTQGMSGFANDKTWVFDKNSGKNITDNTITFNKNAMISYFGRIQYGLKDRYLFSASLRSDGSSKFGQDNRWGWFPSVSGAWRMSEENFMQNISWIESAKIRMSWGQAGNDRIGNSQYLSNMSGVNYPIGDSQSVTNGFVVGNIANSLLRWEKTNSTNIGLDMGFLKNRISFSTDLYFKKTSDLLLKAPVSLTTGFKEMMDNVGNVENWGFELAINTINFDKAFKWNTSFNISLNRNKITSLGTEDADIKLGQGNTIIQKVGHPINSYNLLIAERVLRASDFESDGVTPKSGVAIYSGQRAGDTKWKDVSGPNGTPDGIIDSYDYTVAGNYQPDFEWGLTNTFEYKGFDMSILLQGRVGGDLLSIGSRGWNKPTNDPRWLYMEQWLTKAYWSEDDPGNGKVPAFYATVTGREYDTNWLYDATYVRIKNITLGYTIPIKKSILSRARVYVSCDNVYMWDNYYPGFSPEAATQDNASSDWGSYPQARTFSFGLNVTF